MARILAFAGSTRTGSFNQRLVKAVVPMLEAAGAAVTLLDLKDFAMPIYSGDDEAASGLPEHARRLKALMVAHDGLLIASPEYNGSFSPLLKNTIDWCSRREPGDAGPLVAYKGKVAGICGASGGRLGGLRGLVPLRQLLGNIGMLVIPEQVAVHSAKDALGEDGRLTDDSQRASLEAFATRLATVTAAMAPRA